MKTDLNYFGYSYWGDFTNAVHIASLIEIVLSESNDDIWDQVYQEESKLRGCKNYCTEWFNARSVFGNIEDSKSTLLCARYAITSSLSEKVKESVWDVTWDAFLVLCTSEKDLGYLLESSTKELSVLAELGVREARLFKPTVTALRGLRGNNEHCRRTNL